MVLLNPFQAALYRQLSNTTQALDEVLAELIQRYPDHPSIFSDLFYLLSSISVSNQEAEDYFGRISIHRSEMEVALGHPVDLRVALMDYFVHVQRRYESPKIIELRDYQEGISQAMADSLTGLLNRRSIDQMLQTEMARCSRHNQQFTVMFLDIDNFKAFNDQHGHATGDEVLRRFARFLKGQIRSEDMAARYGGEEFLLLLPQSTQNGIQQLCCRLLRAIHDLDFSTDLPMCFSAGVAEYPRDGSTVADIVKVADERMYLAKALGKDRICLADNLIGPNGEMTPHKRGDGRSMAVAR